jgi:hypothetical protein
MNPVDLLSIFTALTGKTLDDTIAVAESMESLRNQKRQRVPIYWRHYRKYQRMYERKSKKGAQS